MKKTVRLAIGAAGAVPALGLVAVPAAAVQTPAHTVKKSVRPVVADHRQDVRIPNNSCRGTNKHTSSAGNLKLTFFSAPLAGSRTCIGDIIVSYLNLPATTTKAFVSTVNPGPFCEKSAVGSGFISDFCRRGFTRSVLRVCGKEVGHSTLCDFYPF